ncbi:O-antigen ligase family protein [Anaerohalosphaera lusitana]|uniref:O-antigen ligase family protein n=1 Tax=Anaerohalosphaera lusitana TaxID=1936003 RepID=UPI001475D9A3|nr:O-antigen ligase family protein [Anaerohalosphaera lusitana]
MKKRLEIEQTGGGLKAVEWVVMACFAAVVGVRGTIVESPHIRQLDPANIVGNEGASLIISAVVLCGVAVWVFGVWMRGLRGYRLTGMEAGVGLFVLAGLAATAAASDKRASMTDVITVVCPMLAAMVLVQVMDRGSKVRVMLWVLVAVGFVNAYQCADQWMSSNEMMIEQYEENPQVQLEKLGIEEGTLEQWQYEHRLYSKDVKGFFTTGNSAGAFFLMAIAGVGTLAMAGAGKEDRLRVPVYAVLVVALAGGLVLTQSKGAIGGTLIAGFLAAVGYKMGGRLRKYRGLIAAMVAVAVLVGAGVITWYGMEHGRLPGGNSMLVRWQYWVGAARMYAEHAWVGVGGGNFSDYYTHYKIAAAPETVKDPHNFLLSLLTQYGPVGMIGFAAAVLGPMWMVTGRREQAGERKSKWALSLRGAAVLGGVVAVVLLSIRPAVLSIEGARNLGELLYGIVYLHLLPVMFFAIGFLMLWAGAYKGGWDKEGKRLSGLLMWCAIAGVLAHNLIDFAIFEPGVAMAMWVLVACMVSVWRMDAAGKEWRMPGRGRSRFVVGGAAFVVFVAVMIVGVVWPVRAGMTVQEALRRPRQTLGLLERASEMDVLSGRAANVAGRASLQYSKNAPNEEIERRLVGNAIASFEEATERTPASYKNYNGLAEAYLRMGQIDENASEEWQRKAYEAMEDVLARYPGSGEYQLRAGKIADELGMEEQAVEHYAKAVRIEDAYREQFRVMYPGQEIFSRLGDEGYELAKRRVRELCE